jgi:lipopolysaccharide/colanic/teichoic acid biosynthesis glycosyltransferase
MTDREAESADRGVGRIEREQQRLEIPEPPFRPKKGLPRAADLVIAALGLLVTSLLLLVVAVAIRLESPGPVIYRQRRVGKDGVIFELFKLRTMREGADPVGVGTAVTGDDPRVTRVGRFLRRYSLDELPNLINVLRGEMRIVGPRATLPAQVELYTPRQLRRLDLRPGVTGWAQIHGRAGIPWEERIELDVWYVEHRSLALDLKILARTPRALLGGTGNVAPDPYAGSPPDSPLRQAAEREEPGGPRH